MHLRVSAWFVLLKTCVTRYLAVSRDLSSHSHCIDFLQDKIQLSPEDKEEAERAKFNLEVAERRLEKAVQQRKTMEQFQAEELNKQDMHLKELLQRLSDARAKRKDRVAAYQRALMNGALAARMGLGGNGSYRPNGSTVDNQHSPSGDAADLQPGTSDGKRLLFAMQGVSAPPSQVEHLFVLLQNPICLWSVT